MKRAVAQPSAVLFVSRPAWRERPVRSAISVDDVVSTNLNLENRERDRKPNNPVRVYWLWPLYLQSQRKKRDKNGSVKQFVRSVVESEMVRGGVPRLRQHPWGQRDRKPRQRRDCGDKGSKTGQRRMLEDLHRFTGSRSYRTLEEGNDWLARKEDVVERQKLEEDVARKAAELSSPGRCRHRRSAGRAAGSPAGHRSCC